MHSVFPVKRQETKKIPEKGKGHKGLRLILLCGGKKIWFARCIPVSLFCTLSKFSSFIEEIVIRAGPVFEPARVLFDRETDDEGGPLPHG